MARMLAAGIVACNTTPLSTPCDVMPLANCSAVLALKLHDVSGLLVTDTTLPVGTARLLSVLLSHVTPRYSVTSVMLLSASHACVVWYVALMYCAAVSWLMFVARLPDGCAASRRACRSGETVLPNRSPAAACSVRLMSELSVGELSPTPSNLVTCSLVR